MASLSWVAVVLTFSLSVGNNLAVDQNYLTRSVQQILNTYKIDGMQSSFAVNIPEDQTRLGDVFRNDEGFRVTTKYGGGDVYTGTNVVAAAPDYGETFTDHAEARVLDNIQGLAQRSAGHILIIYSSLSPCGDKCASLTHRFNILDKIRQNVIPKWGDYAFVFSTVFDQITAGKPIPPQQIKQALTNLAAAVGQNNIYRCYRPWRMDFRCIKCYNNGVAETQCIKN
ncbi:uncharacterized protein LOC131974019 [Centropristis striata]|uniref:uncharacterized protein LOC131974019 n=1 Tax=Centropristis striata TaxID=184440 RepID=UPI0027E07A23|nr:uncharacterized protein LOC131974019 [Centropristis striata]